MKKLEIHTDWLQNMAFEAEVNGHKITMDIDTEHGGDNLGPRPKPLLMVALAGCTGMDVVSILQKMRVDLQGLRIKVSGHIAEEHPNEFVDMHVVYECTGANLPLDKIQRAVTLSEEKYCGVRATLVQAVQMTSEVRIIEA